MVDQLAQHDGAAARVRDIGAAGSSLLLSHKPEGSSPRRHSSHSYGAKHSSHYAVDECSDGSQNGAQPGPIHEGVRGYEAAGVRVRICDV